MLRACSALAVAWKMLRSNAMLPRDMKHWRPDAFQLFSEEEAAILLLAALILCFVLDGFGWQP